MKNLLFTLILLAFATAPAFSQATFDLHPDTVSVVAELEADDVEAHNEITNLTSSQRQIAWVRTIISLNPGDAKTQVCDPIACYAPWVDSLAFPLGPDTTVLMIMHLLKDIDSSASAIIQLRIFDLADPTHPQYGLYIFNDALSGTNEQMPAANVKLYPNPVVESFTLENDEAVSRIRVYTRDGRQVALFNPTPGQYYSLADQPTGTYLVGLEAKNGRFFQVIEVVKQ